MAEGHLSSCRRCLFCRCCLGCGRPPVPRRWCRSEAHACVFLQGRTALEDASSRSAVAGCPPPTSSTTGVCWSKCCPVPAPCSSPMCTPPSLPCVHPHPVHLPLPSPSAQSGYSKSQANVHRLMSGFPGDGTSTARSQNAPAGLLPSSAPSGCRSSLELGPEASGPS